MSDKAERLIQSVVDEGVVMGGGPPGDPKVGANVTKLWGELDKGFAKIVASYEKLSKLASDSTDKEGLKSLKKKLDDLDEFLDELV